MPFNLNLNTSINSDGLWPSIRVEVEIENTIAADILSAKIAMLDMAQARIAQARNTLVPAKPTPVDEKADLLAEVARLEAEIKGRQLAKKGPGPGRPKKAKKVVIDYQELDNEETRDYMAGKGHLMADPRF